jgi:uncharacterized protein (DUF2141 family)
MVKKVLLITLLIASISFSKDCTLTVVLHRLRPEKGGNMRITLSTKESWSDTTLITPNDRYIMPVTDSVMTVVFKGVKAPNTYAVRAVHDENENGKVDFKILPIPFPTEGFAMSNEYIPKAFPIFHKAAFLIDKSDTLELNFIYGRKDKHNIHRDK